MKIYQYNQQGNLQAESLDLAEFARKTPTPFYLYSHSELDRNCSDISGLISGVNILPCYALKANYNPKIVKQIIAHGFGIDVVSGGELYFALKAGVAPDKIVFAGVGKTAEEIAYAIDSRIHSINVESFSELKLLDRIAAEKEQKVSVAIRVNPDIDPQTHPYISTGLHSNKFGVTRDEAIRMYQFAAKSAWLMPEGIHVHIGSQIRSEGPYVETAEFVIALYHELSSMGIAIKFFDLGGGIGINYDGQVETEERTYLKKIMPAMLKPFAGMNVKLVMELGRSIIATAGILVTKVVYVKRTPAKTFIIVDAAMNNLIRPSLYQAVHQIVPAKRRSGDRQKVDIVGPVCETGDFLARDYELGPVEEGDYLVITGAGAYGQALSSNYNLRPQIAEYQVQGDDVEVIYPGENIEKIAAKYEW